MKDREAKTLNLRELQPVVARLHAVLSDPQPGLVTWHVITWPCC